MSLQEKMEMLYKQKREQEKKNRPVYVTGVALSTKDMFQLAMTRRNVFVS